jgi:hypothetical protein
MASLAIRVASPIVFAAAMLAAPVAADPPVAVAEPREWDVGEYDRCMANESEMVGDIPGYPTGSETIRWCCEKTGGVYDPNTGTLGTCGAPPAVAADTPTSKPPVGPPAPKIPPTPAPFAPVG